MVSLQPRQSLQSECARLNSNKAIERKRAAEAVLELLQEPEVWTTLDNNSMKGDDDGRFTWTVLFVEVSKYFKKESEKSTATQLRTPAKKLSFSVVEAVFHKGATRHPWINWKQLIDFLIACTVHEVCVVVHGSSLITMLQQVMEVKNYISLIDADAWTELIGVLLGLCKKGDQSSCPLSKVLGCLQICIEEGSNHPTVITTLRTDVVLCYERAILADLRSNGSHICLMLRGITILCRKNAVEFRRSLCRVGEIVIPELLYLPYTADEQSTAIVDFLYIQLQLHCPCDVSSTSAAYYADDHKKWTEAVKCIYSFCLDTLEYIANDHQTSKQGLEASDVLLRLAAKSTNQIHRGQLEHYIPGNEEDDASSPKKTMRYRSFNNILSEVCTKMNPGESQIIWMNYFAAVISRFPYLVENSSSFSSLFQMGLGIITSTFVTRKDVYLFFGSLLDTEDYLMRKSTLKRRSKHWDNVWDLTIRSLPLNGYQSEALALLRKLLLKVQPSNVHSLLLVYTNGSIPRKLESLSLLAEYLKRCTLPHTIASLSESQPFSPDIATNSSPRIALLRWLLSFLESDGSVGIDQLTMRLEPLVATMICSLAVRQTQNLISSEDFFCRNFFKNNCEKFQDTFEDVLLKFCFVESCSNVVNEVPSEDSIKSRPTELLKLSPVPQILGRLLELLNRDNEEFALINHTPSELLKRFIQLNYRCSLYLNLLNIMEKYCVGLKPEEDFGFHNAMERLFDKSFSKSFECLSEFVAKGRNRTAAQFKEVVSALRNMLQSSHLSSRVRNLLPPRFPQQIQDLLKKAYRSSLLDHIVRAANNPTDALLFANQDYSSRLLGTDGDGVDLSSENRDMESAALESLECLVDFGVVCDASVSRELFTCILNDCASENFTHNFPFMFEFSEKLIVRLTSAYTANGELFCPEVLGLIISLLQKMCIKFHQIPQYSTRVWKLLTGVASLVANDTDLNRKKFMVLVGTLFEFMSSKFPFGSNIKVCEAGFQTLNEVAKNDPQMVWSVFQPKTRPECWVLNDVHEFFNNPSNQIRIYAVETVHTMFDSAFALSTSEPIYSSQISTRPLSAEQHFDMIFALLPKICQNPGDAHADEGMNRVTIALSCLTRVVFAYPFIQKKSLFSLLQLIKKMSIDITLSHRALNFASKTFSKTMRHHVSFLLHCWLNAQYNIEDFPYKLLDCESLATFYTEFRKEIGIELFWRNNMEAFAAFANFFSIEQVDLIKECYAMLMARIVPGIAVFKSNQSVPGRDITFSQQLSEVQKRLNSAMGGRRENDTYMQSCIGEVVLDLITLLFDSTVPALWGCPSTLILPEPSSIHYDEGTVTTGLTFLKEASSRRDISLIAFMALHSPKAIYDILLTLIERVHAAHDVLEKFWRLHQFEYFFRQLQNEQAHIFSLMKEYVCQFVIYSYIRLLNCEKGSGQYSRYFRHAVIHHISTLVCFLVLAYPEEMKNHYYTLVNTLVTTAMKHPDLLGTITTPLESLIVRYQDVFAECIASLDPFPTTKIKEFEVYKEVYTSMKNKWRSNSPRTDCSLKAELDGCLHSERMSWTLERIQWFKDLLSQKKRDVEKLVKNLEGKRFSDECVADTLHNLIKTLLKIIKKGGDVQVMLEASRCLGEIGPLDLSVLVLPNDKLKRKESKELVSSVICIVETLASYLKSDDIALVRTAGEVLHSLLQVSECSEVVGKELAGTRTDAVLKPFKVRQTVPPTPEKVSAHIIEAKLGLNEINEFVSYKSWITQLTCGLLECFKESDGFISRILPLCRIKMEFCEEILPLAFYLLLMAGKTNPMVRKIVSGYFRTFFSKSIHALATGIDARSSRSSSTLFGCDSEKSIYTNKLALRSLLGIIQFLRCHSAPQEYKGTVKLTPWDSNYWLDVNYFDLAKAAQHCGAYLTSILFTEIAVTGSEMATSSHTDEPVEEEGDNFYSQGSNLLTHRLVRGDLHDKLLMKAYTSIGESDAVYGCGSARFPDNCVNVSHLQQRMQYFQVLSACDGNSVDPDSALPVGVGGAFLDLAMYNTLWVYLKGIESSERILEPELQELQYECGWRLSQWNLHSDKATYWNQGSSFNNYNTGGAFQGFVYESVRTGLDGDIVNHLQSVEQGYKNVARNLRHASIETSENLYGFLSQLQMLREVEDFFAEASKEDSQCIDDFLQRWRLHDKISPADFKFQEPILSLRGVLCHSYGKKHVNIDLEGAFDETLFELAVKARDAGRLELAENCVRSISACVEKSQRKELEIARNHWVRGEQDIARFMLAKLIKKTNAESSELYPNLLLLYGEWLSESVCERPVVILEKYLLRSCQIFDKRGSAAQVEGPRAHFVLAKYADEQYQNVVKYIGSEFYAEKKANLEKARKDAAAVANPTTRDVDVRTSLFVLKKQSNIDEEEINAVLEEQKRFLFLALRHYLRGLKDSNEQDLLIFRMVALWLDNTVEGNVEFYKEINALVTTQLLASYKYLVVLHQLSARLSINANARSTPLIEALNAILTKCAIEHPYHTLPVLLTQALLHEDQQGKRGSKQIEERVAAALKLVETLSRNRTIFPVIDKMSRLWKALIQLANYSEKATSGATNAVLIPPDLELKKLHGLGIVPVPTATLPVSPSGDYKDIVSNLGIKSFGATYAFVGGMNSPKRISCITTKGGAFNMLLKGHDDLRQDAVMQQVFSVMNKLLQHETRCKARRLQVRTYKVVPLSQRTGVLEWCENTQTLGDYLAGDNGAHRKYRPTDYTPVECRKRMMDFKDCGDNEKKYSNFMTILEHFRPAFRHFFFENFKEAGIFFERRLAYTRSVATTSMVGYILGLGDRHVLNILIDNTTAEVIHIDLGVAFEQGRILPIPETIPFRLTRDLVDGMGVSGIEGVYRKSCEMTLEVLRKNCHIIMTILQVLLYDPLYMWTLTADRMKKVQPTDSNRVIVTNFKRPASANSSTSIINGDTAPADAGPKERNSSAARVLLRLKQKLAGIEDGGSSATTLSVPGQVSLLIQRAMDPERLSRVFPGWQPYL